jgi:hypothetical protein
VVVAAVMVVAAAAAAASLTAHRICSSEVVAAAGIENVVVDVAVEVVVANIYRVVSGAWLAAVHEV